MSHTPLVSEPKTKRGLDKRYYTLRSNYLLLNAIVNAHRENTSILAGVVADPYSVYLRGNGKTSYALHVAAAWYRFIIGLQPKYAWRRALKSIVFSVEELKKRIDRADRKEIIIADDIGRWFPPKQKPYSDLEREIFEVLETFRLNCAALIWTAVTPRSVPGKILIHSDYMAYVSRVDKVSSKAELWRSMVDKSKPYKEPKFIFIAEEKFPTYYPDEIHEEYNKRRLERFKFIKAS